jgi:type I restriction enzyme R subunit
MILDKKQMTEEDVKLQYITPAIQSKWGLDRITMETRITVLSEIMEKLKGNLSRENTGGFSRDKLPFGTTKVSAKEMR